MGPRTTARPNILYIRAGQGPKRLATKDPDPPLQIAIKTGAGVPGPFLKNACNDEAGSRVGSSSGPCLAITWGFKHGAGDSGTRSHNVCIMAVQGPEPLATRDPFPPFQTGRKDGSRSVWQKQGPNVMEAARLQDCEGAEPKILKARESESLREGYWVGEAETFSLIQRAASSELWRMGATWEKRIMEAARMEDH
ncbi:hypothetical protein NDU88_003014 [Pleurodeles waltl]|uniref:Uncharacterized protein n=1 Tax=Pleurodeles waltl TaxID=8319 RepID=A0AAV7WN59_PLEWA|nr:hypothetical protein NDU88_003014 [Pleurodeles waltl]